MNLVDLVFDALDGRRPNPEVIAEIEANYTPAQILAYRDEEEGEAEEDLALIYIISATNRSLEGKPLNLEFFKYLLGQGFDVERMYPGELMYDQRGYFLDFIKNKPCNLLQLSMLLYKEFGSMDETKEQDEHGVYQGFDRLLALVQEAAGMIGVVEKPVQDPSYFGSTTQAILGCGYGITIPSIQIKKLMDLCLYTELGDTGLLSCVPGGDFSDAGEDLDQIRTYTSVFLGVVLESADADSGGPMAVHPIADAMTRFGSISSEIWEKACSYLDADSATELLSAKPAYYLTGNGPLVTAILVTGTLSDTAQPGHDFLIGMDQAQSQHSLGVVGKALANSDQGDLIPVQSDDLMADEGLFLIAAYD